MGVTLSTSTPVRLATHYPNEGPTFAELTGGGFVAVTAKGGGTETIQAFNDAGAPVGAAVTLGSFSGLVSDNAFGDLRLAGLTGGGYVAVTMDNTVHSGQSDLVARVYSAAGVLQATLAVDTAPTGASEVSPSVVGTADGGFQVVWTDYSSRGSQTFSTARPTPNNDLQSTTQGEDVFAHAFAQVSGTWQSKTSGDVQVNASGFFTDAQDQLTDTWTQASARLANGNVVIAYNDRPVYNGQNAYFDQWSFSQGASFSVLGADGQPVVGRTVVRNDLNATATNAYNYVEGAQTVAAVGSGFVYLYEERELPQGKDLYEGVHLHFFNADGTSASGDVLVSPVGTSAFYGKATQLANGGGVVVLYQTENPNNSNVTRNLYIETFDTSGNVLSGPALITGSLTRPGGSDYPQADYTLATRADGAIQVVWSERDASTGLNNLQSELFTAVQTVTLPAATAAVVSSVLRIDPNAASSQAFDATLVNLSPTAAVAAVISAAVGTTEVADLAYQFFTGKTPSAAGMDYLVSPTGPNANNLNSAYYAQFSTTNRYINFASNLGKIGEGAAAFQANYGALSLTDATTKAYATIFGTTPTADKVSHLLHDAVPNGLGGTYEREDYFASYGQDGLNGQGTKAAMVGWLLSQGAQADLGTYAKSNDALLTDVANGQASFGVDLIGAYARPSYAYTGG